MKTLFIHASNVHAGGGQALLSALLQFLPTDRAVIALLDTRMKIANDQASSLTVRRVKPSIWQRLKAEWWLSRNAKPGDLVLCFGNLPPLFKLQGRAWVFVQNRYLIDAVSLRSFPIRTRLRLMVERLWFSLRSGNAHGFIVQTPTMKSVLGASGQWSVKPVHVWPFVNSSQGYQRALASAKQGATGFDFVYVASGEPHKNHRQLILAWCLLAQDGQFPSLGLTLDARVHPELCDWIDQEKQRLNLRVENLGVLSHPDALQLYVKAKALIYPSSFESFGLPLIEARQAGLAVVASELDFVRDVLDPEQSFDPQSPMSIVRAVKRFVGVDEKALPLLSATQFMANLLEKCD